MSIAKIVGNKIVIEIRREALERREIWPNECRDDFGEPFFKTIDARRLAEDIVYELNLEDNNGDTPLTNLLDACLNAAVANGSEGVVGYANKDNYDRIKRSRQNL